MKALSFSPDHYKISDLSDMIHLLSNNEESLFSFWDDNGGEPDGNRNIITYEEIKNAISEKAAKSIFAAFPEHVCDVEVKENIEEYNGDDDYMFISCANRLYTVND